MVCEQELQVIVVSVKDLMLDAEDFEDAVLVVDADREHLFAGVRVIMGQETDKSGLSNPALFTKSRDYRHLEALPV